MADELNRIMYANKRCTNALKKWFENKTGVDLTPLPPLPDKISLVLGFPLWGSDYIDSFLNLCLPSLLAPKNKESLKDSCLVIFTREEDVRYLTEKLKGTMAFTFRIIPEYVLKTIRLQHNNKYWILGACEYLSLQIACKHGFGYHMLMPDFVYSDEYFPNLFRLAEKHEAMPQTTISAKRAEMACALDGWRKGNGHSELQTRQQDIIEIPARELGDLAYKHIHNLSKALLMNGKDFTRSMPNCHSIMWVGKDAIYIYSCHLNISYLSPRLVRQCPPRLYNPLDTELPTYMPNEFYIPKAEDNMLMVEISGNRPVCESDVPMTQWLMSCGMATHFNPAYDRFFAVPSVIPVKEQREYASEDEIRQTHSALMKVLDHCRAVTQDIYDTENEKILKRAA